MGVIQKVDVYLVLEVI